mgnify:CR=1 FL=1
MANNNYTKNSIQSLTPREHVQKRPSMYCGDTSTPNQLMLELFSNALDEHNIGHGNVVEVSIDDKTGVCSIQDYAQGFLINQKRDDGKTVFQAAFDTINTSGKYTDDGVYEGSSLGLNGLGSKLVTFLSKYLKARTVRDGRYEQIEFKKGIIVKHDFGIDNGHSGTYVEYLPDGQYFGTNKTSITHFKKFFNDITCICPTLKVVLNSAEIAHDSVEDMLDGKRGNDTEIISNHFVMNEDNIRLAMTFTSSSQSKIISYVNYGLTSSGPHITGIKSTLTRVFNSWARVNNLLKDKEKNLDGAAIQEGLILVCNIDSKGVKYNAQVKDDIIDVDTSFTSTLGEQLEVWLDNNPTDAKSILDKAIVAKRAAEAAKKARAAVKNQTKRGKKVKILHPDKLKDAEYLGNGSTLLLVEGLSAGASMCVAREIDKYGILMLRGKLINALANKDEKLLKNEEIQLLFKALGIQPGEQYNESELRYGRIGICVDADSDGFHIGLLIASALEHFCPQFIQENRLCWLRSPLYIVKNNGKETYYFTDQEMNKARKSIPQGAEVQRCKGLGSLSASQARNSMFGVNQHMDVLVPSKDSGTKLMTLMGSNSDGRKEFIFNNIDFSEVKE